MRYKPRHLTLISSFNKYLLSITHSRCIVRKADKALPLRSVYFNVPGCICGLETTLCKPWLLMPELLPSLFCIKHCTVHWSSSARHLGVSWQWLSEARESFGAFMGGMKMAEMRGNYSKIKSNQTPPQQTKFSYSQSKGNLPEASNIYIFIGFKCYAHIL